jgi:hypothetical protein
MFTDRLSLRFSGERYQANFHISRSLSPAGFLIAQRRRRTWHMLLPPRQRRDLTFGCFGHFLLCQTTFSRSATITMGPPRPHGGLFGMGRKGCWVAFCAGVRWLVRAV